jgi:protein MAK11
MLSAAEDGTICAWSIGNDWDCLSTLNAHKGKITGLAVHPSGSVALSVARDRMMHMWDLNTCKSVFSLKVKTGSSLIQWCSDGSKYALAIDSEVRVFSHCGDMMYSLVVPSRVLSLQFAQNGDLVTGSEDGRIRLWADGGLVFDELGSGKRITALARTQTDQIVSASSDGSVLLWDLNQMHGGPIARANTKLRITAICGRTDNITV